MYRFNENLFLISIAWCFIGLASVQAAPVDYLLLDGITNDAAGDYDMMYDQRQNGTENFRLRVDGVIMAFPASASTHASSAFTNVAANYLLQLASAIEDDDNDNSNSGANDDTDENYFNFVKNANKDGDATPPALSASDVKDASPATDDKTSAKPSPSSTETITVESVAALNANTENAADKVAERISSMNAEENEAKVIVVPVKKIQARRRNK